METTAQQPPAPAEQRASLLPTALIGAAFLLVTVIFAASSSWYLTFKTVHVIFAVVWIGGGLMLTILGVIAEMRDDPVELATIARQASMVGEKLFTPASIIVLLAGIAMMINVDWGWEHFWVVFGLIGFASTFALGIGVLAPLSKNVATVIEASGVHSPEAQAVIKRLLLVARIDVAVLMLVVVDMIVKPFS